MFGEKEQTIAPQNNLNSALKVSPTTATHREIGNYKFVPQQHIHTHPHNTHPRILARALQGTDELGNFFFLMLHSTHTHLKCPEQGTDEIKKKMKIFFCSSSGTHTHTHTRTHLHARTHTHT